MNRWLMTMMVFSLLSASGATCQPESGAVQQADRDGPTENAGTKRNANNAPTVQTKKDAPTPTKKVSDSRFADNAFPPTLSDSEWHRDWLRSNCLRCHETGVADAPTVVHEGMADVLLTAACRSCHVLVPGSKPKPADSASENDTRFAANAFPPMVPNSESHRNAWNRDDCFLCHESGIGGAPVVIHKDMPAALLESKCRSCHVQVRAITSDSPGRRR